MRHGRSGAPASSSRGLTLVEVLVALAIGAVVLTAASGSLVSTARFSAAVEARGVDAQRRTAVPLLLRALMGSAGRGRDGCGLEVAEGGRRLRLAGRPQGEASVVTTELFSGLDGGGRPALYHRTVPHARQPILEEVSAFAVVAGRDQGGAWRAVDHDGATRWTALELELLWTDGDRRRYVVDLVHGACAEVMP